MLTLKAIRESAVRARAFHTLQHLGEPLQDILADHVTLQALKPSGQRRDWLNTTADPNPSNQLFTKDFLEEHATGILMESIGSVDLRNKFSEQITKSKLDLLSPEATDALNFTNVVTPSDIDEARKERLKFFLTASEFVFKGHHVHFSIVMYDKQNEGSNLDKATNMSKKDVIYPMLIGDQYHAMSFYLTTMIGSEIQKVHSDMEEGYSRFHCIYPSGEPPFEYLYKKFYHHMPNFLGNAYRGTGVILGNTDAQNQLFKEYGEQLGWVKQFAIFKYLLAAYQDPSRREEIEAKLMEHSFGLQYVSMAVLKEVAKQAGLLEKLRVKSNLNDRFEAHVDTCYDAIQNLGLDSSQEQTLTSRLAKIVNQTKKDT